ncbi:MAG: ABC transporter ATP-binding protein [Promethearchaeota archaeon]
MTRNQQPVIDVKHLSFAYTQKYVVEDISFFLEDQEILGVLGPNGAGKTTTIRLITGVLPIKKGKGEIYILGRDITAAKRACKTFFGVVPEISNAYLDLSVWENLMLSGRIFGLDKKQVTKRANDLLELFDLQEKKHVKTKSLSKGLKQRLNFCLALLHDPEILILDEPSSGLDPISMNIVRKQIRNFKKEGKSILLTTHDLKEAEKLCDKVIIMNKGKIVAFKSPDDLKKQFKTITKINFTLTKPPLPPELEKMLVEKFSMKKTSQTSCQIASQDPFKDISELYQAFKKAGVEIDTLTATGTSLEEIFIKIIDDRNKNDDKAQSHH